MKKLLALVFILSILCVHCKNETAQPIKSTDQVSGNGTQSFGAQINDQGSIAFTEALEKLNGKDSLTMKLTAKVTEVCQAKGCWMNVVAENGEEKSMFVKFKDYAFFVPKDCAGKKVVMDGVAYKEVTSVDELRHYASDKGASKEEIAKITEPKEELKFMASGVLLFEK